MSLLGFRIIAGNKWFRWHYVSLTDVEEGVCHISILLRSTHGNRKPSVWQVWSPVLKEDSACNAECFLNEQHRWRYFLSCWAVYIDSNLARKSSVTHADLQKVTLQKLQHRIVSSLSAFRSLPNEHSSVVRCQLANLSLTQSCQCVSKLSALSSASTASRNMP